MKIQIVGRRYLLWTEIRTHHGYECPLPGSSHAVQTDTTFTSYNTTTLCDNGVRNQVLNTSRRTSSEMFCLTSRLLISPPTLPSSCSFSSSDNSLVPTVRGLESVKIRKARDAKEGCKGEEKRGLEGRDNNRVMVEGAKRILARAHV